MTNPFLQKKILVVTAHPDDESPLAAGTIRQVVDSGGEVRLMCATLGEKGRAHLATELSDAELKQLRLKELQAVGRVLGFSKVFALTFSDGALTEYIAEFEDRVVEEVVDFHPDYLLSFGPDGYTCHADHVAACLVSQSVSEKRGIPLAMFSLPPEPWRASCIEILQKKRKFGAYHEHGELQEPNVVVQVDKDVKLKAIRCHETQLGGLDPYRIFPPDFAEHFLTYEYFVLAT